MVESQAKITYIKHNLLETEIICRNTMFQGFARGVEEANAAVSQFDKGLLKSIDGEKPPPCPVDQQDDYCDG
jgi:hypothetical protein